MPTAAPLSPPGYLGYASGFSLSCMVFFLISVSTAPSRTAPFFAWFRSPKPGRLTWCPPLPLASPPTLPGHLQEVPDPLPSPRPRGERHGQPQLHGSQRRGALGRLHGAAAPRAGRLHPQLLHPQLPGKGFWGLRRGGPGPGASCPCPALSHPPPRRQPTPSPSWPSPSCATPRCCPSTRS